MYLVDSKGNKSLTATLSIVAFVIVMVKLLVNNSAIQIGEFTYSFGAIDASEIAAVLGPILGTYAFRRYTDTRFGEGQENEEASVDDVGSKPRDGKE